MSPRNRLLDGVKVRRIHSLPSGVTRQLCGLLSKLLDHLLLLLLSPNTEDNDDDDDYDGGCRLMMVS